MKDRFLKANDLISVFWKGRLWFFWCLMLAVLFSSAYSLYASSQYHIYTILGTKNIEHSVLDRIKVRFDNNYYNLNLAQKFNISPEDIPSFKINLLKYYLHPEISIVSNKADIEKHKEYIAFLQDEIREDTVNLVSSCAKIVNYDSLIEQNENQIASYLDAISKHEELLEIYELHKQEAKDMLAEHDRLLAANKEASKKDNDSLDIRYKFYVLSYISKQNAHDIWSLDQSIKVTKKQIEMIESEIANRRKLIEDYKKNIVATGKTFALASDWVFVKKDVSVEKQKADWIKNFILFFFAMMFLATGIVLLKEIAKE